MAKETYIEIAQDLELNGTTVEVTTHSIVIATPNKVLVDGSWVPNTEGLGKYARLHDLETQTNYIWDGDVNLVDENTTIDDPNWKEEV